MRFDSPNTLAYLLDIPHRRPAYLGHLNAQYVGKAAKASMPGHGGSKAVHPDWWAVEFYALNQLVSAIQMKFGPHDELPEWALKVVQRYVKVLSQQSLFVFHYLLLITTRESRHVHHKTSATAGASESFRKFFDGYHKTSSEVAQMAFTNNPPDCSMKEYVECIRKSFEGHFSGGFGGKPWWNIADCPYQFVMGKTSAEVMVDTAYTLAHNNGPIFNKGMYFQHYTGFLARVLDVQRSGQVCELALESPGEFSGHAPSGDWATLKEMINIGLQHLGVGKYVDWYKVEDLGSVHKYPQQKHAQVKAHGDPKAKPPAQPKITLLNNQPVKQIGNLEVLPASYVAVFERVHA